MDWMAYPVLGFCGWSNSGKTTLIEKLLPWFVERNLSVVVVKRDAHGLHLDLPGKDSDRFFQAGADVQLLGPDQSFVRSHVHDPHALMTLLPELAARYDFIVVEGNKQVPIPKVWLTMLDHDPPPTDLQNCIAVWDGETDRVTQAMACVQQRLEESLTKRPLWGCVLMDGQRRRRGTPKHLLTRDHGQSWLAYTVEQLRAVCKDVVVVGEGELPADVGDVVTLPDSPDLTGPLAGILTAMRWDPGSDWLVAACDLPQLSVTALQWLVQQRRPETWGVLPRLAGSPGLEPLLAFYSMRCRGLFEAFVTQQNVCPVAEHSQIRTPTVPADIASAWFNANTPDDFEPKKPKGELL